jgi:hypothetical protein
MWEIIPLITMVYHNVLFYFLFPLSQLNKDFLHFSVYVALGICFRFIQHETT